MKWSFKLPFKRKRSENTEEATPIVKVSDVGLVSDYNAPRPVGGYIPLSSMMGVVKSPVYYLPLRMAYILYYNSDILRTVIRALIQETFRNGIDIIPAYVKKCAVCGAEYQEDVDRCKVCGGKEFIVPNELNKRKLQQWLRDANVNNESLMDVLMAIDFDLNVADNAFLTVLKRYYFDENGNIVGAEPAEILRADPRYMQLIMSMDGRMGYNPSGDKVYMFCPAHRDRAIEVDPDKVKEARCPKCGRQMLPAYYRYSKGGKTIYYAEGEVLHVKKFTYGIGYGYSPVLTLFYKLLILLKQDYFILMAYHLMRAPKGLLVIKGASRESVEKAWQRLMEYARVNPHAIYPLVVEGDASKNKTGVEFLDLSFKDDNISFIDFRHELRQQICAMYGVMPVFIGEGVPGRGNETMQVLVTNRAVELEQRLFNEKILPWLTRQLGIDDWRLILVPNEQRDVDMMVKRLKEKLDIAERLKQLGFDFKLERTYTGEWDVVIVPKSENKEKDKEVGAPKTRTASSEEDRLEQQRLQYYERHRLSQELEGEPEPTRPRLSEQRLEGEPPSSPLEQMEGKPT